MNASRMTRLGASDQPHFAEQFDKSVEALIHDANGSLPPGTVYEIRHGHSQDGEHNDLQWLTTPEMQAQTLWARVLHGGTMQRVLQADGKTTMPRVSMVARVRTPAIVQEPTINDAPVDVELGAP